MVERSPHAERWLARVTAVIAGLALVGTVSLEAVASHLGTSPRTLQRRLNCHGVTFRMLVEESRLKIAAALLQKTDLKVQEIAASLGYSTPGGFARAFAGWAGRSPSDFRARPTGQPAGGRQWREKVRDGGRSPVTSNHDRNLPEEV